MTSGYIVITEDNAYVAGLSDATTSRRKLDRSGATFKAADFIHAGDVPPPTQSTTALIGGSDSNGTVFTCIGGGKWHSVSGMKLEQVAVGPKGLLVGVSSTNSVHRYEGNMKWSRLGSLTNVDVGAR